MDSILCSESWYVCYRLWEVSEEFSIITPIPNSFYDAARRNASHNYIISILQVLGKAYNDMLDIRTSYRWVFFEISNIIVGFGLCLEIGMFPLIPPIGCILFVPSMCWNKLERYLERYLSKFNRSPSISVYYNAGMKIEFLVFMLYRIEDRTLHRIVSPMLHITKRNENLSISYESRY